MISIQRRLAEGTSSWLLFEFHCNRGDLFSEKQLVTPVGQVLSGSFPGRIKTEVNHPVLTATNKKGRPLQLDFVILDGDNWVSAVETKWVTKTPISLDSILWDLIRLELVAREKGCISYFVVSGFAKKMIDIFLNTHFYEAKPKARPLFTVKGKQNLSIDLSKLPDKTKKYLLDKLSAFDHVKIPKKIFCEFPHRFPEETINMTFKTVVWKVNYLPKHQIYKPVDILS